MGNSRKNLFRKIVFAGVFAAIAAASLYFVITSVRTPSKVVVSTRPRHISLKKPTFPKTISGKIITLRVLTVQDAFDYYSVFSDKVRKFLDFSEKMTFGEVELYVRYQVNRMDKGQSIVYAIIDNVDKKLIGTINIRDKNDDDPGQLGMWLNENYWGGGRIQEAMLLISKAYLDSRPNEKSYIAHVRPWNPRSIKSMEKFGFKKVGDYIEKGKVTRYIYEISRETIYNKLKTLVQSP